MKIINVEWLWIIHNLLTNLVELLDAYPLQNLNEMVKKMTHHEIFSTIHLKSYHQISISGNDKIFTAFKAI